jgi:hypothetical protein
MVFIGLVATGFILGWVLHWCYTIDMKEYTFNITMKLSATEPVKISAIAKDKEGNLVDLALSDLALSVEAIEGDFGSINDENDTFNPGSAGAKGKIVGTINLNQVSYRSEVEVELVPGAPATIELNFVPTEEFEPSTPSEADPTEPAPQEEPVQTVNPEG